MTNFEKLHRNALQNMENNKVKRGNPYVGGYAEVGPYKICLTPVRGRSTNRADGYRTDCYADGKRISCKKFEAFLDLYIGDGSL